MTHQLRGTNESMNLLVKAMDLIQPRSIVVCGRSGLIRAGIVSAIDWPWGMPEVITVRKPGEQASFHTGGCLRGYAHEANTFVDDVIDQGRTLWRAHLALAHEGKHIDNIVVDSLCGWLGASDLFRLLPRLQRVVTRYGVQDRPTDVDSTELRLERPSADQWDLVPRAA